MTNFRQCLTVLFLLKTIKNKANVNSAQMKGSNSADDSDNSDGDEEEQDANKTHDEVSRLKCRLFTCLFFYK